MRNKKGLNFNHSVTIKKILSYLAEAEKPLPNYLDLYSRILAVIDNAYINTPQLSDDKMALFSNRISEKRYALFFEDIETDWNKLKYLMLDIISVIDKFSINKPDEVHVSKQISLNTETLVQYAKSWYENLDLTKNFRGTLVSSVLHGTMYPVLASYSDLILKYVKQDMWYQRFCPVCGGIADFSYLNKETGARWLVCSRCDSQWVFYRLVCPFCGNEDHQTLSYLTGEGSPYRLYLCDKCNHYLKCIDLRKTNHEVLLPLERLLTLDLDRQAQDKNYTSP